jgi:hypothetical protein
MKDVALGELPPGLAARVNRPKFLYAYAIPERGRHIVRHVTADGRLEELEYDDKLGRCLTLEERARELPVDGREVLESGQVTVASRYFLASETHHLTVHMDVADAVGKAVLSLDQPVYATSAWTKEKVVAEAWRLHRFPLEYASWPRNQKVAYWASTLHRWRRSNGESGGDEDEIYSEGLVKDMEKTDPKVRLLLPDILAFVGRLEQTPPAEVLAAFTSRTGIALHPPTPHAPGS